MLVRLTVLLGCLAVLPSLEAGGIYGEHKNVDLSESEQQGIVAAVTVILLILMAKEVSKPEVLFLIALMVVTLAQIITMADALSGKPPPPPSPPPAPAHILRRLCQ